jgi:hypothetical protein
MMGQLNNERGIALVVVILIMTIFLSITSANLLFSALNLKTAAHFNAGSAAIYVADAGIQHALAVIPPGGDFDSLLQGLVAEFPCAAPCDGSPNKPTLNGSLRSYSYSVTVENDIDGGGATNDTNRKIVLTSSATQSGGFRRRIKAYVGRSSAAWAPPGTIYVPGPANDLEFRIRGSAIISGNDTDINGQPGPRPSLSAISTTDAAARTEAIAAIETPANVIGAGGAPSVAVVSSDLDVAALANGFLALSHSVVSGGTLENSTLGSWSAPQITRITGDARFRGTSSGAGVLIIDGELRIEDQFNFKGLIILRAGGELQIQMASASATIFGAVLIAPAAYDPDIEVEIEGGGEIRYSSEAISKVDATWPGVLPQQARLLAWHEIP